jgi:thiamine transport system substrate-binding protein
MRHLERTIFAIAAGVALTACSSPSGEPDAASSPTSTPPASLTLVTHDSFNISEEVIEAFEDDTGISVDLLAGGDAGTTVNQAILTAGDPQGDVLFGVDNTFLSRALDADVFVPYESPELEQVDEALVLDPEHRVTPIDYGDVCLNIDRAYFADADVDAPTSLEDLTEPAYEGLTVVENPATSSPGLAFLLATIERFGEDGYLDYWADLRANDVLVTDGWEDAYYGRFSGGSGEGDRPIVVSYASSPPAEVIFADPQPDEAPTAVVTDGCFRQIEFAGILAGTEHEEAARLLIDWMLSVEFQEDMPLQMFVFPVHQDADLPPAFVEHTTIPDDPISLDPQRIADNRDDWIEAWTRTVLR